MDVLIWPCRRDGKDLMIPKLISFKLCPFVQRASIVLRYKAIEHEVVYIDLASPPEWFLNISPLKKVPLLLIGDQVIFESSVINEYLDEAYPRKMHPEDLLLRAKNRAWIEFGNVCMWDAFHLSVKETEQEFNETQTGLLGKFDQLEKVIGAPPFFNGKLMSLVDASFAPLLQRLKYIDELKPGVFDCDRHPKINSWKDALLELEIVQASCVPEIEALYHEQLWKRQGFVSRFLDQKKYHPNAKKSMH